MAENSLFFGNVGQFYGGYCTSVPKNAGYYFWNGTRWFRGSRGSDGKCAGYSITLSQVPTQVLAAKSRELERFVGIQTAVASHYPGGNEPAAQANIANYAATAYPNTIAGWDSNANYHRTLSIGKKGADVAWVQSKLGARPVDGDYGGITKAAVVTFQRNNGLTADGIFGPKSACKLGMPGAPNCGGTTAAPRPAGTTGGTGGGTTPAPAAAPAVPPPPPKPDPPYKLPKYAVNFEEITNFNPISTTDLIWAEWGVFNAYELANMTHNQYFQAVPPQYNVISDIHTTLAGMDQTKFLMDENILKSFASPQIDEDYETLAFGAAKPNDPSAVTSDRNIVYIASRITSINKELQRRLIGVKFLSQDIFIPIDGGGPYHVTWISRRIGAGYSNYEPIVASVSHTANTLTVSWASNSLADYYVVFTTKVNGSTSTAQTGPLSKTTTSWTTGALAQNTTECFVVRGYKTITDINGITSDYLVGESQEVCDTIPLILIPQPASFGSYKASNGIGMFTFNMNPNTSNFNHVFITAKEGGYPQYPGDGIWSGQYGSGNAGQWIQSGINLGTGTRPNDRAFYYTMWTRNSLNQASPTVSQMGIFFLRNPVEVWPVAKDSWRTYYNNWESCCNRARASNYGSTVGAKYTGLWFYNGGLRGMGGRNVVHTQILLNRLDGGDGGAIPAYLGNHNYGVHPGNNNEPPMYNVAATGETIARNSSKWVSLSRYNGNLSRGEIEGFGMYRRVATMNDLHTWIGQEVSNDGVVQIYHADYP